MSKSHKTYGTYSTDQICLANIMYTLNKPIKLQVERDMSDPEDVKWSIYPITSMPIDFIPAPLVASSFEEVLYDFEDVFDACFGAPDMPKEFSKWYKKNVKETKNLRNRVPKKVRTEKVCD
jgi:hypothetical protein